MSDDDDDKNIRLDGPEVLRISRRLAKTSDRLAASDFADIDLPDGAFGNLPAARRLERLHTRAHRRAARLNAEDVVKLSEFSEGLRDSVEYLDTADQDARLDLRRLAESTPEGGW